MLAALFAAETTMPAADLNGRILASIAHWNATMKTEVHPPPPARRYPSLGHTIWQPVKYFVHYTSKAQQAVRAALELARTKRHAQCTALHLVSVLLLRDRQHDPDRAVAAATQTELARLPSSDTPCVLSSALVDLLLRADQRRMGAKISTAVLLDVCLRPGPLGRAPPDPSPTNAADASGAIDAARLRAFHSNSVEDYLALGDLEIAADQRTPAVESYERALTLCPMDRRPVRALLATRSGGDIDERHALTSVLHFQATSSGLPADLDEETLREATAVHLLAHGGGLEPVHWARLAHPDDDAVVNGILGDLAAEVLRSRPSGPFDPRFVPPELSSRRFREAFAYALAALGLPGELHVADPQTSPTRGFPELLRLDERKKFDGYTLRELMFVAGRQAAFHRPWHLLLRVVLEPGELGTLLSGRNVDPARWRRAQMLTSARAGLLLAGDLHVAQKMLRAEAPAGDGITLEDVMNDLVIFAASPTYFELRQVIGYTAKMSHRAHGTGNGELFSIAYLGWASHLFLARSALEKRLALFGASLDGPREPEDQLLEERTELATGLKLTLRGTDFRAAVQPRLTAPGAKAAWELGEACARLRAAAWRNLIATGLLLRAPRLSWLEEERTAAAADAVRAMAAFEDAARASPAAGRLDRSLVARLVEIASGRIGDSSAYDATCDELAAFSGWEIERRVALLATPTAGPQRPRERELLLAICGAPHDNALRVELAQLVRRRDPDLSWMIRYQFMQRARGASHRIAFDDDLVGLHPEWSAPLRALGAREIEFERGFPERVTVDAEIFRHRAPSLWLAAPLGEIVVAMPDGSRTIHARPPELIETRETR